MKELIKWFLIIIIVDNIEKKVGIQYNILKQFFTVKTFISLGIWVPTILIVHVLVDKIVQYWPKKKKKINNLVSKLYVK